MGSLRPRQLTELIGVLWRRKKLVLLMFLAMLLATLIVIRRIPNLYESSALVAINLRNDAESMPEMNWFAKLQQELTSREVFATLIRRYNLYPKAQNEEEAIGALQKALKIETKMRNYSPQVPEAVEISLRHSEPKIAQAVVTDLVRMFEHGNEQKKTEASAEAGRLTSQITEVEERLRELAPERDLEMIRLESLYRSGTGATIDSSQRRAVESSIESLADTEYSLKQQVEGRRKEVAEYEKLVNSLPATTGSAAYGALLTEKSKIEADIQSYSDQYTDKHPKMIQLRNQLAEINRHINRLEAQTAGASPLSMTPEGRDLIAMRRDLRRMEADLEVTQMRLQRRNQQLGDLPKGDRRAAPDRPASLIGRNDMARAEYDTLVKRYNWLLDKQDSLLKSRADGNESRAMFYVIDKASLPRLPSAPNRLLLQIFALAMATAFGLAVALAIETPRMFRINDSRDVEYFLGAQVLAAIPESLTPAERARKRKLRLTRGALVMTAAVALAPVLVFLLRYLRVFQIIASR
jgi:succinoglycan biosynthesis transport protein ExoP